MQSLQKKNGACEVHLSLMDIWCEAIFGLSVLFKTYQED